MNLHPRLSFGAFTCLIRKSFGNPGHWLHLDFFVGTEVIGSMGLFHLLNPKWAHLMGETPTDQWVISPSMSFVGPILTIHVFFFVGVKRTTHCSDHFLDPQDKNPSSTSTGHAPGGCKRGPRRPCSSAWWLFRKSIPHSEAGGLGDQSCGGVLNPEGLFISSRSFS